jgi:hypothetical protein
MFRYLTVSYIDACMVLGLFYDSISVAVLMWHQQDDIVIVTYGLKECRRK